MVLRSWEEQKRSLDVGRAEEERLSVIFGVLTAKDVRSPIYPAVGTISNSGGQNLFSLIRTVFQFHKALQRQRRTYQVVSMNHNTNDGISILYGTKRSMCFTKTWMTS